MRKVTFLVYLALAFYLPKSALAVEPTLPVTPCSAGCTTVFTLPAFGQATMANSLPFTIASDQTALSVTVGGTLPAFASTPTFNIGTIAGIATAANQPTNVVQGSTTSGQTGTLMEGAVTTAVPSYTTLQTSPLSLTLAGALRVDSSAVTQPVSIATLPPLATGGNTIGRVNILGNNGNAMDATGQNVVSPAAELLVGAQFNTTPTTLATGNMSPLQMDNAGNLLVNIKAGMAAGGTSSNFGAAFPPAGTAIGVKNGANMVNLNADGSGNLDVNCTVGCAGGTTSNASSGVATSSTNGATVAWLYLFNGTTWDQAQDDANKNLKVVAVTPSDTVGTLGALGALNNTVTVAVNGQQGVGMLLSAGTLIGTIIPEISYDGGTTWIATLFFDPMLQASSSSIIFTSSNTVTSRSILIYGGVSNARVRVSAYTSGTANAVLRATLNPGTSQQSIGQGTNTSGQLGLLVQGAVTTSAPSYTNTQTDPLSLTPAGALRVDASATAIQGATLGSTPPSGANIVMVGPVDSSGNVARQTLQGANGSGLKQDLSTVAGTVPTEKAASTSPALADTSLVVVESPNANPVCTSTIAVNQTASTDLVTLTNFGYICSVVLISATAQNFSLVEGTGGTNCSTSTVPLIGGSSASVAAGANGGFSAVANRPWLKMARAADHLCLLQSGTGNISGVITYQDHL